MPPLTPKQRRATLLKIMRDHTLDTGDVAALTLHARRTVQAWIRGTRNVRASTLAFLLTAIDRRAA